MTKHRVVHIPVVFLAVFFLAQCGKSSTEPATNPAPAPTAVRPAEVGAGGTKAVEVTVLGSKFVEGATVQVGADGTPIPATAVWPDSLHVGIPAAALAVVGTLELYVTNPAPGGGVGGPVSLSVVNPVPTVTSLYPVGAEAGSPALDLTVNGTGFVNGSQILVNGSPVNTQWIIPTMLKTTLPATDLENIDTLAITVSNPAPGGGVSPTPCPFPVMGSSPILDALPAGAATANGVGFDLRVDGANFLRNTVVRWNGADRPTTYVSPERITAAIGGQDVATPGNATITVYTPGAGASGAMDFTVHDFPAPAILDQHVLDLPATDVVWSPSAGRLYAAIPASSTTLARTVVAIDPNSGTVTDTASVDMDPARLAISGDGSTLYVAFSDTSEVERLTLPSMAADLRFDLGSDGALGPYRVGEMAVVPGAPSQLLVSLFITCCTPPYRGMKLFDDGVARSVGLDPISGTGAIAFASPDMFYSYDDESTEHGLSTVRVTADGLYRDSVHVGLFDAFVHIHYANDWVYSDNGRIADGGQFVRLASLDGAVGALGAILPEPALGRAFFLKNDGELSAYDLDTFQLLGSVTVAGVQNTEAIGDYWMPIVRWGTDGIAFRDGTHTFILRTTLAQP